jgi:hypothetical protein
MAVALWSVVRSDIDVQLVTHHRRRTAERLIAKIDATAESRNPPKRTHLNESNRQASSVCRFMMVRPVLTNAFDEPWQER